MSGELVDAPGEFRSGEALDAAALQGLFEHELGVKAPLRIQQFRRGHSNLTYFVTDGESEWVLRRPPFGSHVKTAHDMKREYRILSGLHRAYEPAPKALLFCDDESVIGAEFYVMERVRGLIIREALPAGVSLDEGEARRLSEAFVDNLARIHAVDLTVAGLEDFGRPEGFVERQVNGWIRRYHGSRTDEIDSVAPVSEWLQERLEVPTQASLIHYDYKFDNLVLNPDNLDEIVGVLDWEMSTIGHPLMDLGSSLAYWLQADDDSDLHKFRFVPVALPGMLTRDEIVRRYGEVSGRPVTQIDFYYVFGLVKLAVIAQQIYYRFATGKTEDRRFAAMIHAVRILFDRALAVISASKL